MRSALAILAAVGVMVLSSVTASARGPLPMPSGSQSFAPFSQPPLVCSTAVRCPTPRPTPIVVGQDLGSEIPAVWSLPETDTER